MIKYLKENSGLMVVRTLAAIPIIIWLFMMPLADRFSSSGMIFRSLGQVTGLLGMALLSINFILSARYRFLDKWFNGLNLVYIKHHTIGAIAFCLLLFHPTFLTIQYLFISLKASYLFIFSLQDFYISLGKIALLVLIVLLVITFYLNFKYQNWKSTHQYLGLVLFLGGWHMLFVPSDIANNAPLRLYMLLLATLGALSYFYRTILGIYKRGEYKYKLEKIVKASGHVAELIFSPLARKIKFLPGQFVFLRFDPPEQAGGKSTLSESHPFSITSYSEDDNLSIGIKTLGDYTSMVYLLEPGAICSIEGPFGVFSYRRAKSKRQIWVAGGIGITPFLGMARQINFDKKNSNYRIDLYYSAKNETEIVFLEEFTEISQQNGNFKFQEHFSEKSGYLSADLISKNSENISGAEIFLCGPSGFMKSLREQFVKLGFKNNQIHSEEFSL